LIITALAIVWRATRIVVLPSASAIAVGTFGVLAAVLWAEQVFAAFGGDLSLTGRVPLWAFVWGQIAQLPWLGQGFAVYFDIPWVQSYIVEMIRWNVPNAHNGELWLGILGPVLLGLSLIAAIWRALVQLRLDYSPAAVFIAYFLPIYLMRNIGEFDSERPASSPGRWR
jgi:O-antigen ligase